MKRTVKTKETKETKAPEAPLAPLAQVATAPPLENFRGGVDLSEVRQESPFLPYLYLTNPKTTGQDPWRVLFSEGNEVLEAPWCMAHILTTPFVRRLEGSEYKERAYPQKHEGYGSQSTQTFSRIRDSLGDARDGVVDGEAWQQGLCHLVYLIEKTSYATIEVAGSLENYWVPALVAGDIRSRTAAKITWTTHEKAVKVSRAGFRYLAAWKFKGWEAKELTPEEIQAASRAWSRQSAQIENFLRR